MVESDEEVVLLLQLLLLAAELCEPVYRRLMRKDLGMAAGAGKMRWWQLTLNRTSGVLAVVLVVAVTEWQRVYQSEATEATVTAADTDCVLAGAELANCSLLGLPMWRAACIQQFRILAAKWQLLHLLKLSSASAPPPFSLGEFCKHTHRRTDCDGQTLAQAPPTE